MGYDFTDNRLEAKLIIFNTCAVREHAEDRVFGNVGALKSYKRENHDVVIALCGCMMQQQHIADKIKNRSRLLISFSELTLFISFLSFFTEY